MAAVDKIQPTFDREDFERAQQQLDREHQGIDVGPTRTQLLGRFTVVCLILNRTIGSGIFATPGTVFDGTGSVGIAMIFWVIGGLFTVCRLLVWLELGLSVPVYQFPHTDECKSVPRSGGEKNYLEYLFSRIRYLTTCIYGIMYLLLGNLSGNAIAFALYILEAAGKPNPSKRSVIGVAIAVLTAVVFIHMFSRKGGIWMNNAFAVLKVAILLAIIVLGFVKAGGKRLGGQEDTVDNWDRPFTTDRSDLPSYADAFLFVLYSYSGFEQPFYVLAEVKRPRKTFPVWSMVAVGIAIVLYILANAAYICVVPLADIRNGLGGADIATVFFDRMFGGDMARRVMAGIIALSIFGNLVVMTFTASRVKQEIAKEGILPFSLTFATSSTTLWARLTSRRKHINERDNIVDIDSHLERTPMAALALHWFTSVLLIAVTAATDPQDAYSGLVSLNSYVMILGVGFAVSVGLLYHKIRKAKGWSYIQRFKPWLDPVPAVLIAVVSGFLMVAVFVKPSQGSPFLDGITWYIIPTVGVSALTWGLLWWFGLKFVMFQKGKDLVVERVPVIIKDDDDSEEWVQVSELVDHEWHTRG